MNKSIKHIMALTLAISVFSVIQPAKYLNLIDDKVYASTDDDDTTDEGSIVLSRISLSDGSINFSRTKTSYDVHVKSSVETITVKAVPRNTENATVKIDGTEVTDSDDYEKSVELDKGENTVKIKVINGSRSKVYTLNITRGTTTTTTTTDVDEDINDVHLSSLELSNGSIDFSSTNYSYDVNVESSVDELGITAKPEDESYDVTINGTEVDEDCDYKNTVKLNNGKNKITVKVENNDDNSEKAYTINVIRGTGEDTNSTSTSSTSSATASNDKNAILKSIAGKCNQWVKVNNKWMYNDESGSPLKDSWFTESSNGNTYYLQSDGTKKTGWLNKFSKWYYFNESGVMKTGWQYISGNWYYMNSAGAMQTGWININDKWYYLNESGAMAKDTTIDGYTLDSSGALIS